MATMTSHSRMSTLTATTSATTIMQLWHILTSSIQWYLCWLNTTIKVSTYHPQLTTDNNHPAPTALSSLMNGSDGSCHHTTDGYHHTTVKTYLQPPLPPSCGQWPDSYHHHQRAVVPHPSYYDIFTTIYVNKFVDYHVYSTSRCMVRRPKANTKDEPPHRDSEGKGKIGLD